MPAASATSDVLKKSEIKWAQKIRQDFDVRPLFTILEENKQKNDLKEDYSVLSLSYGKLIVKDKDDNKGLLSASNDSYQRIEPGYIVLRLTDLQNDQRSLRVGLAYDKGIITSAYVGLKPKNSDLNTKYLYYLLHSYDLMKVFYGYGGGIRQGMSYGDLKKLPIILPNKSRQLKIVNFLDDKLRKIDIFIENKQQYIKKLQECKQIVINDAVTKGVDSDGRTKFTADWLPESPTDWQAKRLKYLVKLRNENDKSIDNVSTKVALENIEGFTGKYIETGDPFEGNGTDFKKGDILFGKLRPYLAKVYISEFDGQCVTDILPIIVDSSQMDKKFMYYRLLSMDFINEVNSSTYGAKMPRANWGFISNLSIPYPSKEEQKSIVLYIESETKNIDIAIDKTQNQIELIKEYRDSLITHAVTGQVEIKE